MRKRFHNFIQFNHNFRPHGGQHATGNFPAGTFAPGAMPKAYGMLANLGTPKVNVVLGIGSLGGNVPASDITAFCQAGGYLTPNLKFISVDSSPITSDPGGANVENNLDWQMAIQVWARAYPNVPMSAVMAIGPNAENGIPDTMQALREEGASLMSWSWGAPNSGFSSSEISNCETEASLWNSAGKPIVVASGDNSKNDGTSAAISDYMSSSAKTWSAGGTSLGVDGNGNRISESAWGDGRPGDSGGGGGYNSAFPIQPWQAGVIPNGSPGRGTPDSSLNADPNTGYQMLSDGQWAVVGGTSAAAPATMAYMAVLMSQGASFANYQATLYGARASAFNDILTGSDGYPAAPGWDPATGLGSINGAGFAAALLGQAPPVGTNPPPINPPTPVKPNPPTSIAATVAAVRAALQHDPRWTHLALWERTILLAEIRQAAQRGQTAAQILAELNAIGV